MNTVKSMVFSVLFSNFINRHTTFGSKIMFNTLTKKPSVLKTKKKKKTISFSYGYKCYLTLLVFYVQIYVKIH